MKSCKSHETNETKNIRLLVFSFSQIDLAFWCFWFWFFHVVCKISNFNMWTSKHLAQASVTELTLWEECFCFSLLVLTPAAFKSFWGQAYVLDVKSDNLQYNLVGRLYEGPAVWWSNVYIDRLGIIRWDRGLLTWLWGISNCY